jgi:hypothetical protein
MVDRIIGCPHEEGLIIPKVKRVRGVLFGHIETVGQVRQ